MVRVRSGVARRKRRRRVLKLAKGYRGQRSKCFRKAHESLLRSGNFAFRDRRVKKREFRRLWIVRIGAAARELGMTYSQFIYGAKQAGVVMNRKQLAELAIHDPNAFAQLVDKARTATASA